MKNTHHRLAAIVLMALVPAMGLAVDSPHWTKDGCQACHMEAAPTDGLVNLNAPDAEALCDTCHGDRGDALPCRHASGIPVGDLAIHEIFRESLKDEKLACTTCHDVVYQCERPKQYYGLENRGFLRDRTSRRTGEYCFKCHGSSEYKKMSPHKGVAGAPPKPTCMLCHESIPESSAAGELSVTFNMQDDLNDTCRGCHNVRPHPKNLFSANPSGGWVHLVEPSAAILENMRESRVETGIGLPLNPQNGEVFCATCHNPHDFKVGGDHGSEEPGMKNRLRMNNICQACHDK